MQACFPLAQSGTAMLELDSQVDGMPKNRKKWYYSIFVLRKGIICLFYFWHLSLIVSIDELQFPRVDRSATFLLLRIPPKLNEINNRVLRGGGRSRGFFSNESLMNTNDTAAPYLAGGWGRSSDRQTESFFVLF